MVILKWLKHIFSFEFINIIKGNYARIMRHEARLFGERYPICHSCPKRAHIDIVGEICDICGCPLESKLRVKEEKCDLGKW